MQYYIGDFQGKWGLNENFVILQSIYLARPVPCEIKQIMRLIVDFSFFLRKF